MQEMITFKPVFWRLMIWKTFPILVGMFLGIFIYQAMNHRTSPDPIATLLGGLIGALIGTIIFRNQFNIVISEGQISGLKPGLILWLNRETFPIADFDKSNIHKQSFYEKISGYHTLRSLTGKEIMLPRFIFGKAAVDSIHKILEQGQ